MHCCCYLGQDRGGPGANDIVFDLELHAADIGVDSSGAQSFHISVSYNRLTDRNLTAAVTLVSPVDKEPRLITTATLNCGSLLHR